MAAAIGDVLGLAAGVAISPLAIIVVILLLTTTHGRVNAAMFALGRVVGLLVVGAVTLLIAGSADASSAGEPAAWVGWLKLLLGVVMLAGAVQNWAQPASRWC